MRYSSVQAGKRRKLSLLCLIFSSTIMSSGCASLLDYGASAAPTRHQELASEVPTNPTVFRQLLIESSSLFTRSFSSLPDTQIVAIVSSLPESPRDLKVLKEALLQLGTPAGTKRELLKLGEEKRYLVGGMKKDTELLRRQFLEALDDTKLQNLAAVVTESDKERANFCRSKSPRIHNVGLESILIFETAPSQPSVTKRERAVRIPVDGRDLHPRCVTFHVQLTGAPPLSRQDWEQDFVVSKPTDERPDSALVLLLENFIDRMKTGDKLTVQIAISQQQAFGYPDRRRVVSFATRTFTLYELNDYRRQVLASRIAAHDIRAFPLPEEEAIMLFGPLIAENFFVVRMSVRNTESEAKLISTGMITASGRAIVEPIESTLPTFTVPVTVVPSSLEQVYSILDDEEVNQPRSKVFRTLEFVGALASAATSAFVGTLDVNKGISLFTGVAMPESKKLWPDRWPGYKRNVVNYAMPDLLKVAANSVSTHKHLFFSKKDLEGVIADHNMFLPALNEARGVVRRLGRQRSGLFQQFFQSVEPDVRVISVGFDNLDIRFEKVFETPKVGTREEIGKLLEDMPKQTDWLESLSQGWLQSKPGSSFVQGFTIERWQAVTKAIRVAKQAQESRNDNQTPSKDDVLAVLGLLESVAHAFDKDKPQGLAEDLVASPDFGLQRLQVLRSELSLIARRVTAGVDAEQFSAEVRAIKETLAASKAAHDFYVKGAALLIDEELGKQLAALNDAVKKVQTAGQMPAEKAAEKEERLREGAAQLQNARRFILSKLELLRTVRPSVKLMKGIDWARIETLLKALG